VLQRIFHIAIALLAVSCSAAVAQQLGAWSAPQNLGLIVNSACNDMHPTISKDGLSLIFSSNRPFDHWPISASDCLVALHLWVSERDSLDSPWQPPQPLAVLDSPQNSPYEDHSPNLTTDAHWLFFHSSRPGGCNGGGFRELWAAHRRDKRNDFGWETPINLGCALNIPLADDAGPNFWEDDRTGTLYLYFTRDLLPSGPGTDPAGNGFKIYVSTCTADLDRCNRQQLWEPGIYVTELNFPGARDTRTAIRGRDGLEMIISSNRAGTAGVLDLWVSTRLSAQDPWSIPINLNQDNVTKGGDPSVNTTANDSAPALSWDGQRLIFFSNRAGGYGGNDLYMSTRPKLGAYSIIDLGTLGGTTSTACGINDRGQVTGRSAIATGQLHAFLWQNAVMTDLGTLPGRPFSNGRAINNRGQVVGDSSLTGGPPFEAALWENGGVKDLESQLGGTRSFAIGINNRGQVVGGARTVGNLQVHGFLWHDGEMKDLGVLGANDQQSVARAINSRDQVVGNSSLIIADPPSPPNRSFLWQNGEMTDLGTLGGDWAIAWGMNERGQIVGGSFLASGETHAFLWEKGVMTDLGTLRGTSSGSQPPLAASCNLSTPTRAFGGATVGTFSLANGINSRGQVVGRSIALNGEDHAFVWSKGVMTDLNHLIPSASGWTLMEAADINESGQIVGFGAINNQTHAFLLIPDED